MKFSELKLNDNVLEALDAMRFDECTPIQEQSIPVILEGRDLIAVAQTGTGKTAAYLLPVLNKLSEGGHPEDSINCIVMAPTRELAQQIDQQMEGFSYFMPVSSVAVYGGNDGVLFEQQKRGLTLGADVVIATPGRLIAHLSLGYVDLSRVSYFILDEADRMLDMGFYDDIMQIDLSMCSSKGGDGKAYFFLNYYVDLDIHTTSDTYSFQIMNNSQINNLFNYIVSLSVPINDPLGLIRIYRDRNDPVMLNKYLNKHFSSWSQEYNLDNPRENYISIMKESYIIH